MILLFLAHRIKIFISRRAWEIFSFLFFFAGIYPITSLPDCHTVPAGVPPPLKMELTISLNYLLVRKFALWNYNSFVLVLSLGITGIFWVVLLYDNLGDINRILFNSNLSNVNDSPGTLLGGTGIPIGGSGSEWKADLHYLGTANFSVQPLDRHSGVPVTLLRASLTSDTAAVDGSLGAQTHLLNYTSFTLYPGSF